MAQNNVIYIVEGTHGTVAGYWSYNIMAFDNKEEAEKYAEKYERIFKAVRDFLHESTKDWGNLEVEVSPHTYELQDKYNPYDEFVQCRVEEMKYRPATK